MSSYTRIGLALLSVSCAGPLGAAAADDAAFKVACHFDVKDPVNTFKARAYDLRKQEFRKDAVEAWLRAVNDVDSDFFGYLKDVKAGGPRGEGDAREALERFVEDEKKTVAANARQENALLNLTSGWQTYTSKARGFAVLLPSKPSVRTFHEPQNGVEYFRYTAASMDRRCACVVQSVTYPASAGADEVKRRFDGAVADVYATFKAKTRSSRWFRHLGYPALEVEYEMPSEEFFDHSKLLAVRVEDRRQIVVLAWIEEGEKKRERRDQFLGSLELWAPPPPAGGR